MIENGNVTILVDDLETTIVFYTTALGFQLDFRVKNAWAQMHIPGLTIGLHPKNHPTTATSNSPISLGFSVKDLDQEMARLTSHQVTFERVSNDGPVRLAFFRDPDGTSLYLAETQQWT